MAADLPSTGGQVGQPLSVNNHEPRVLCIAEEFKKLTNYSQAEQQQQKYYEF